MNADIQFKWEDCVAKDGNTFKFSKIRFEGVDFGISLGKATLETKENEKFFLWVYRTTPLSPDCPDFLGSAYLGYIPANSFDEAMEYAKSKREVIRRAMYVNIARITTFNNLCDSMKEFIKKQKEDRNDKANMRL